MYISEKKIENNDRCTGFRRRRLAAAEPLVVPARAQARRLGAHLRAREELPGWEADDGADEAGAAAAGDDGERGGGRVWW